MIGLALHIPATGALKAGGPFAVGKASALRGLADGMRFGDTLARKLQNAADGSDAAAQLAALLMGGLPVADATAKIAASITKSAARAFDGRMPSGMQQELQRALASALAPPGTSPPLSLAQQAQTLVQKLRSAIETVARETKTGAGQQSRFSGDILDAVQTAKEIPAQTTETVPTDSIVADVIAQLRTAASASQSSPAPTATQTAAKNAAPSGGTDIVGRMIARALTASQPYASAPKASAAGAAAPRVTASVPNAVLFQRLVAIVAQATQADGGANKRESGSAFDRPAAGNAKIIADQTVASNAPAFAVPFAREVSAAPTAATAAPYSTIDPQALIDQVVKGFAVRTSGSTTEVRMRLHPDQLGDVSLKLTVNGGTIDASIVAQNADVRQTLVANQHQLAQALSDAGLSLGNFSVDVSGGQGGRSNEQQAQLGKKNVSRFGLQTERDDETVDSASGPSILNRPQDPWLLNYFA